MIEGANTGLNSHEETGSINGATIGPTQIIERR